jgi:hypothetical protein
LRGRIHHSRLRTSIVVGDSKTVIGGAWEHGFDPLTYTGLEARGIAALFEEAFDGERSALVLEKCKASREIKDPQQVTMKNGRPAIQGTCPDCGTKIFKIGKLS